VYASIGAVIFSLYIIYDTYSICNTLHPDEYIVGAVNLYPPFRVLGLRPSYLDIINLFLYILRILNATNHD
jgi:protein lifeguard